MCVNFGNCYLRCRKAICLGRWSHSASLGVHKKVCKIIGGPPSPYPVERDQYLVYGCTPSHRWQDDVLIEQPIFLRGLPPFREDLHLGVCSVRNSKTGQLEIQGSNCHFKLSRSGVSRCAGSRATNLVIIVEAFCNFSSAFFLCGLKEQTLIILQW